jgi:uncharacterized repeat protein (TIGR03803 family)
MKILRIPSVIALLVVAGRIFTANAQMETNLYSFVNSPNDGAYSAAGLVQGSDGNFYGTASGGGTSTNGTVFRISPSGSYTNLYSFGSYPKDGAAPYGRLVQGSDGNFYGTTQDGGTNDEGTVFRISPSGSYANLYSFGSHPNDGAYSEAGLVQGSDGNFYGTTTEGGSTVNCESGCGTVFRISPSGSYTNLHSFVGRPNDGQGPAAGLVQGSDGNFYGTTEGGGTYGPGTVFRISPNGNYTNLYSFGSHPNDGAYSAAGLVQGSDGNFYGTTTDGGSNNCQCGTVFRISPNGSYSNLYSFAGSPTDGNDPQSGLVQGGDGNFYGTTWAGGTSTNGNVFQISPSGSYSNLYSFGSFPNEGANPNAGLVQGSDGNFYGTTYFGGTAGAGIVFKLTVPLNPPPYPINQITGVKVSGTNVVFNIPSIEGETYQLQFSSSMKPTNWVNVSGVSVTNSIGSILTLTNFGGASTLQRFYRFDITP